MVRWNWAQADFTPLSGTGTGLGVIADGVVIRLEVSGNSITALETGAPKLQAIGSTWGTGNSSIGMFTRGGDGVLGNFG